MTGNIPPKVRGFRARPVIAGVFIPSVTHPGLWQKHATGADTTKECVSHDLSISFVSSPCWPSRRMHSGGLPKHGKLRLSLPHHCQGVFRAPVTPRHARERKKGLAGWKGRRVERRHTL